MRITVFLFRLAYRGVDIKRFYRFINAVNRFISNARFLIFSINFFRPIPMFFFSNDWAAKLWIGVTSSQTLWLIFLKIFFKITSKYWLNYNKIGQWGYLKTLNYPQIVLYIYYSLLSCCWKSSPPSAPVVWVSSILHFSKNLAVSFEVNLTTQR